MTYFGEGGGCFGMGESQHVLCMHHHDVAYSSQCGKNMSRCTATLTSFLDHFSRTSQLHPHPTRTV